MLTDPNIKTGLPSFWAFLGGICMFVLTEGNPLSNPVAPTMIRLNLVGSCYPKGSMCRCPFFISSLKYNQPQEDWPAPFKFLNIMLSIK